MSKNVTLEKVAEQVCIDFGRNANERNIAEALHYHGFSDPDHELTAIVSEMCANATIRVRLAYIA